MSLDLRKSSCGEIIDRVQAILQAVFDPSTEVRKRRSLGFRTDRGTWVRIEVRGLVRIDGQGWGIECASVLKDVAMPAWHQGVSWIDHERGVMWRADETECVSDQAVKLGGTLTTAPDLSESWWEAFSSSMTALAAHTTTRTATPHLQPIAQDRFGDTIHQVFPDVDATITEWRAAHADLAWGNLTAPNCYFLDWEDWGMAPRGFDASTLWSASLAVPELAHRVYRECQADLDSHTGKLVQLYHCAEIMAAPAGYAGPLLEPAGARAAELVKELQG
ncbi:hypothetical protein ABZ345_13055 [Lentzea sp. NPDC005914]|uniref:hypothetical protein n=1 Tax=Lentzea sp. NPDC005914 TaxID=3154572 RepID=UPI0033E8FE94